MYPDHSPEAAMQLADLKSYSKLNEEFGSAEDDDDDGDGEDDDEEDDDD